MDGCDIYLYKRGLMAKYISVPWNFTSRRTCLLRYVLYNSMTIPIRLTNCSRKIPYSIFFSMVSIESTGHGPMPYRADRREPRALRNPTRQADECRSGISAEVDHLSIWWSTERVNKKIDLVEAFSSPWYFWVETRRISHYFIWASIPHNLPSPENMDCRVELRSSFTSLNGAYHLRVWVWDSWMVSIFISSISSFPTL